MFRSCKTIIFAKTSRLCCQNYSSAMDRQNNPCACAERHSYSFDSVEPVENVCTTSWREHLTGALLHIMIVKCNIFEPLLADSGYRSTVEYTAYTTYARSQRINSPCAVNTAAACSAHTKHKAGLVDFFRRTFSCKCRTLATVVNMVDLQYATEISSTTLQPISCLQHTTWIKQRRKATFTSTPFFTHFFSPNKQTKSSSHVTLLHSS